MRSLNVSKDISMDFFNKSIEKYGGVRKTAKMYGINAASVSGYASGKISCSQQRYEYCKAIYEGNYTAITEPFIVNLILGKNIEEIKETLDLLGYELIIEVRKKV